MPFPGVTIEVENGNLLRNITVQDGIGAIVATSAVPANTGKVQRVYSLKDAEEKGYTSADEPFLHGLIQEFYRELGGNQELWVMGVAETQTMSDTVDSTNENGLVRLLTAAGGDINLVALSRKPEAGYDPGSGFLDKDVQAVITGSLPVCQSWQGKNKPFRVLVDGRVTDSSAANTLKPKESGNGFAGVVLGGSNPDGSSAVATALARACKYPAHVKLGSGQNGAVTIQQVHIGADKIEDRLDMEQLHDAGFITFHRRPGVAGYYFGVDNMAEQGDFRILVHGRVIDKAQRITAAAYTPYIEDYVNINSDGTIASADAKHLEDILLAAIRSGMEGQISGAQVVVDVNQNIINTSRLNVEVKVLPLGYLTWINVTLGLTTQLTQ